KRYCSRSTTAVQRRAPAQTRHRLNPRRARNRNRTAAARQNSAKRSMELPPLCFHFTKKTAPPATRGRKKGGKKTVKDSGCRWRGVSNLSARRAGSSPGDRRVLPVQQPGQPPGGAQGRVLKVAAGVQGEQRLHPGGGKPGGD